MEETTTCSLLPIFSVRPQARKKSVKKLLTTACAAWVWPHSDPHLTILTTLFHRLGTAAGQRGEASSIKPARDTGAN